MDGESNSRPEAPPSGVGLRSRRSGVTTVGSSGAAAGTGAAAGSNAPTLPGEASRREFLSYLLSLMRGASDEHADLLPIVDLGAYRHVAYVTDAFLYLIMEISETPRSTGAAADVTAPGAGSGGGASSGEADVAWDVMALARSSMDTGPEASEPEPTNLRMSLGADLEEESERQTGPRPARRPHSFFQRTASTLALGCPGPDPINTPLEHALPLAYK